MKKIRQIFNELIASDKFWATAILLLTFAAFFPALGFKELISDDNFYWLNVLSVQNSFRRIFDPVLGLSTPLTSLSLYLDFLIWGKENFATGAHLTNILLHCGTGILFYLLLRSLKWGDQKLSPAWAGMAALIFLLHPQRVESVVWICERKDCLAMFLGVGALLCFLRDMRKEKISWAAGALLLLSFLAKPMWLFFFVPAAALIWSEKRTFQWKFYLKQLFLPLLLFLCFTTYYLAISEPSVPNSGMEVPFLFKVETILHNYGNYFVRTFIPGNLFPLYPYYNPELDPRWMALVPLFLCLTPLLARNKEFRPALIYGVIPLLICFAVILIPVAGFNRVGNTDFADRYSYLPALFLITGVTFLLKLNLPTESAFGRWLPILGVLYCGGLLYKTELYLPVWESNIKHAERSMLPEVPNFNTVFGIAVNHYKQKEYDKALSVCEKKLPECAHYPDDFKNIIRVFKLSLKGLILFNQGKPDEGITYLNTIYMSPYSGMVRHFPIEFAQQVFVTGANYHLIKYGDRKAAANLYHRCAVLFKLHSPLYEAFYAGMSAMMNENYADAVRYFTIGCQLNPQESRCRQNLDFALQKLKEQKK